MALLAALRTRPYGACASRSRACRARQRAAAAQVETESQGSDLTSLTPSQVVSVILDPGSRTAAGSGAPAYGLS